MRRLLKNNHKKGFSLVEVMLVTAIISVLLLMAIPNINRARITASRFQCVINLRKIAVAKEHWSLETEASDTATPDTAQLDPYIQENILTLICPLDPGSSFATSYDINNLTSYPACKIDSAHVFAQN